MPYWRLFYHIVWATKKRQAFITPAIESSLYRVIIGKADTLNCYLFAINGMPDHIHLVASILPALSIPEFIRHVKGSSSRHVHLEYGVEFTWQPGYGIFSVSTHSLKKAIAYVDAQKTHHTQGTIIEPYERCTNDNNGPQMIPHNHLINETPD